MAERRRPALLFFDSDGTLISNSTRKVPRSTVEAIKKTSALGNIVVVNTGRPYYHIDAEVISIGFDGFICACGMYIRYHDTVIRDCRLSKDFCVNIRDYGLKLGVEMSFESHDAWFYDGNGRMRQWHNRERENLKKTRCKIYDRLDVPEFRFDKFFFMKHDANIQGLTAFASGIQGYFQLTDRGIFYECVPKGFSKAEAIGVLSRTIRKDDYETYAFGDSQNDLEMLKHVDYPVLMGEAPEDMRLYGFYVTKGLEEDGLFWAMKKYGLA